MKTTIEIDDDLFRQAKVFAAQRGITLKELVHTGLELALAGEHKAAQRTRVHLPLIASTDSNHRITLEDVYKAIRQAEDEAYRSAIPSGA